MDWLASIFSLESLMLRLPVVIMALTFHEFAHASVAYLRGDDTARQMGRMTLNPLDHLDIMGTIALIVAPIGWAKPVPVNPARLKNPRRDDVLVSAAGPGMNLLLALISGYILQLMIWTGTMPSEGVVTFIALSVIINIGLAVFNMLPVFPLDGSHVFSGLISPEAAEKFQKFNMYGPFIILGMVLFFPGALMGLVRIVGGTFLTIAGLSDIARVFGWS